MNWLWFDLAIPLHRAALQGLVGVFALSTVAWLLCKTLARKPMTRHLVATSALIACLMLPALSLVMALTDRSIIPVPVRAELIAQELEVPLTDVGEVTLLDSVDPVSQSAPAVMDVPFLVLALYGAGAAFGVSRLIHGYRSTTQVVRNSLPVSSGLRALLEKSGVGVSSKSAISKVVESPDVKTPLVAGAMRPVLVFPAQLPQELEAEELRQIVAHEEAHVKNGHLWLGWLQRIVTLTLWPVPTVHALAREATTAQEDLCDLAALSIGTPTSYARALVRFAELSDQSSLMATTCAMIDPRLSLESRIRALLDPRRRIEATMKTTTKAAVFGTTFATMLLLAGTQIVLAHAPVQDAAVAPTPTLQEQVSGDAVPGPAATVFAPAQDGRVRVTRKAARLRGRKASVAIARPVQADGRVTVVAAEDAVAPAIIAAPDDGRVRIARAGRAAIAPTQERLTTTRGVLTLSRERIATATTRGVIAPTQIQDRIATPTTRGVLMPGEQVAPAETRLFRRGAAPLGGKVRTRLSRTGPNTTLPGESVAPAITVGPNASLPGRIVNTRGVLAPVPASIQEGGKTRQADTFERVKGEPAPTAQEDAFSRTRQAGVPADAFPRAEKTSRAAPADAFAPAMPNATITRTPSPAAATAGGTTVIRNATVIIHGDGTVEIKGGTRDKKVVKPKVKAKTRTVSKPKKAAK